MISGLRSRAEGLTEGSLLTGDDRGAALEWLAANGHDVPGSRSLSSAWLVHVITTAAPAASTIAGNALSRTELDRATVLVATPGEDATDRVFLRGLAGAAECSLPPNGHSSARPPCSLTWADGEVLAVASREYQLRLEGISSPPGQIPLRDLAEIGNALQQAATRIARQFVGAERRGRAPAFVDRVSEIRLTGLGEGSTVLELQLGDEEALPIPGSDEDLIAQRLEESFIAIAANSPPEWASPLVRESIGRLVLRVEAAGATQLTATWGINGSLRQEVMSVSELDATVWAVDEAREVEHVALTGLLDKVDLRARRFRIHDDVGNDITLEDVVDLDTAAHLIGQRVVARGVAERSGNRVARIIEPTLIPERLPEAWSVKPSGDLPPGAPVPRGGIPGLTASEVDEYLEELRA